MANNKIDWSQYEVKEEQPNKIDWSQYEVNEEPLEEADEELPIPESTGLSGVFEDLLGAALSGVDFVKDIPEMTEALGEQLLQNPATGQLRGIGQLAAGTAEVGKGLINSPKNLTEYLIRKNLHPAALFTQEEDIERTEPIRNTQDLSKSLSKSLFSRLTSDISNQLVKNLINTLPGIPEDTGIEKAFGLEEKEGDKLLRSAPKLAAGLAGGSLLAKEGSKFFKAPDLKQSIRDIQAKVNKQTKDVGKIFDHVEKEVGDRGISQVPIDNELLDQARELLSKTLANKKLFEKAKKGDFDALRKLQGDLRNKGEKGLSSNDLANNELGELMLETRDEINASIQNHLENTGNEDLAKALNKARKDYRQLQETYHSTNKLSKTFGKDQFVPHNPITLLREESTQMNRFMEAHPELEKALSKALDHTKKMKLVKALGKYGVPLLVGEEVGRKIIK